MSNYFGSENAGNAWKLLCTLAAVLLFFGGLELFIPIRTTVQIGADEGFELAKATLCLKGYKLYTDVWNDHAPLHTFLITELLKHVSPSVAGPRLLTIGFAALLITSVFLVAFHFGFVTRSSRRKEAPFSFPSPNEEPATRLGLLCAVITSLLLIASPGFLELSSSCMLEIPALAPGVAALCVLYCGWGRQWYSGAIIAGMLFGISLGMKLIGVVLLPIAAVVLWARFSSAGPRLCRRPAAAPPNCSETAGNAETAERGLRRLIRFLLPRDAVLSLSVVAITIALTFAGLDLAIDGGAFLRHFHQSWMSHFAPAISSEYGSPNDHRFPFTLLLKNWDLTIPAAIGVLFLLQESLPRRRARNADFPVARFRTPSSSLSPSQERARPRAQFCSPENCSLSPSDGERVRGEGPVWISLVPVVWLAFALGLFTMHKPWWTYYYIHIAIPLCLCAGFGLARLFELVSRASCPVRVAPRAGHLKRNQTAFSHRKIRVHRCLSVVGHAGIGVYAICALLWITTRAYLEISGIRKSPQT